MTNEEIDALPDEFALKLRKPIQVGTINHHELVFHEPLAGQLEEASRHGDMRSVIVLLALSAGVPPVVIEKLGSRDLKKATSFIESFTQGED